MSENHPPAAHPRPIDTAKVLRPGKTTTALRLPRPAAIGLIDPDGQANITAAPGDRHGDESAAAPTPEDKRR